MNETLKALSAFGKGADKFIAKAVGETAIGVRADAIKAIDRGSKSGRTYVRGAGNNLSGTHTASAAGEAPASDSGSLVSSIKLDQIDKVARVFSPLPYSFWLEFGTLSIAPRPFLNPAVDGRMRYFQQRLARALDKAEKAFSK